MNPAEQQLYDALRRGYRKKIEERRRSKSEVVAEIRAGQTIVDANEEAGICERRYNEGFEARDHKACSKGYIPSDRMDSIMLGPSSF